MRERVDDQWEGLVDHDGEPIRQQQSRQSRLWRFVATIGQKLRLSTIALLAFFSGLSMLVSNIDRIASVFLRPTADPEVVDFRFSDEDRGPGTLTLYVHNRGKGLAAFKSAWLKVNRRWHLMGHGAYETGIAEVTGSYLLPAPSQDGHSRCEMSWNLEPSKAEIIELTLSDASQLTVIEGQFVLEYGHSGKTIETPTFQIQWPSNFRWVYPADAAGKQHFDRVMDHNRRVFDELSENPNLRRNRQLKESMSVSRSI